MDEKNMIKQSTIFNDLEDKYKGSEGKGSMLESDDLNKWELDTDPLIDSLYHELLGEVLINRSWTRDPKNKLRRVMNEEGASTFKSEIRARVNRHMGISELDDQLIREITGDAGENFADLLREYYEEWEVDPREPNLRSICDKIVCVLRIGLLIAKDAGMRRHREKKSVGGITRYLPQGMQPNQEGGAY